MAPVLSLRTYARRGHPWVGWRCCRKRMDGGSRQVGLLRSGISDRKDGLQMGKRGNLTSERVSSLWQNPRGVRPAIHPGQTTGDETHAAQFSRWGLGRRSIPADRVAARRSSLRFGRNTPGPVLPVGAPPSRALSAGPPPGGLAPPGELGLAPTGRTGQPRRSPGFHHRLQGTRSADLAPSRGESLRCLDCG